MRVRQLINKGQSCLVVSNFSTKVDVLCLNAALDYRLKISTFKCFIYKEYMYGKKIYIYIHNFHHFISFRALILPVSTLHCLEKDYEPGKLEEQILVFSKTHIIDLE